jgi:predicted Zn-dependent peptidase
MFQRTKIPDGPRVITARVPGARSVAASVYVLAGSRTETQDDAGAAHFMEHLTFRGTAAYPSSKAISEAVEGCGGSFNAATDRESTVYWAKVPGRQAGRAVEVLSDLIVRPLLREEDIAGERDIIVEEIRSYRDDPVDLVGTLFDLAMFGETPLGREIAGDEGSVQRLAPDTLHDFWTRAYRPANCVIAVAGDLEHDAVVDLVAKDFGTGNGVVPGFSPPPALPSAERIRRVERDTAQAHFCVGVPGLRRDDPESWTLELANTVLGEGMSSRLFLIVREQLGLAYDVAPLLNSYADCGVFGVSAGVDPVDLGAALDAVLAQLARLRDERVGDAELDKAKAYAGGRLELRLEETHHLAGWYGVQEALHDEVLDLDDALEHIDAVTAEGIQDLAGRLLADDRLALAIVAPAGAGTDCASRLRLP